MPSPCAVFTSAPDLRSEATASRLPCIAASTTEAGAAAWRNPAPSAPTNVRLASMCRFMSLDSRRRLRRRLVIEIQLARAVAELLHVVAPEHVEHREHRVGHGRS